MTPEAAILVLSAAHYRRGMTVVAFIFFSRSASASLSSSPPFPPTPPPYDCAANISEEKVPLSTTRGNYNFAYVNIDSNVRVCIL